MRESKIKEFRRLLRAVGLSTLSHRVWKRLLRLYRETPAGEKAEFVILLPQMVSRASDQALTAAWGRMNDEQRAKAPAAVRGRFES